jgi:hypothetical protein
VPRVIFWGRVPKAWCVKSSIRSSKSVTSSCLQPICRNNINKSDIVVSDVCLVLAWKHALAVSLLTIIATASYCPCVLQREDRWRVWLVACALDFDIADDGSVEWLVLMGYSSRQGCRCGLVAARWENGGWGMLS